jgi:hypothetical protein
VRRPALHGFGQCAGGCPGSTYYPKGR